MKQLNTKEDVYQLLYASTASAALGTAVETGLLWMLAEKPLDGASVAQTLNIFPLNAAGSIWAAQGFLHNPDFCFLPTFAQVKAQLAEIGFEILPDQYLHSFGWIVLLERKGITS